MPRNDRRDRQKAAQLCAQVSEALSLAMAAIEDDVILDLYILEVTPAPDAGRLRVQVAGAGDPEEALARLERWSGQLRAEVASSIHRKKTPQLLFEVIPRSSEVSPSAE